MIIEYGNQSYNIYNKMNPFSYDDLRWCDRQKYTQIFHHIEAFAKKIRKRKEFYKQDLDLPINANAQQKEIDVFYKQGWQYDHAHPTLTCDISDPLYVQSKCQSVANPELAKYFQYCQHFMERLRSEHEDQTAFRVESIWAKPLVFIPDRDNGELDDETYSQADRKNYQNIICAKRAYKSFLDTIEEVLASMTNSTKRYEDVSLENYPYFKIMEVLQTIEDWVKQLKQSEKVEQDEEHKQPERHIASIYQFMANFIEAAEQVREKKRSCLFNYQPQISILTYLIHPALLSLYGFYRKQKILWKNQYEHNVLNINFNIPIQSPPLLDDPSHFQITRTVFINLDGYESQFNIEFAKNMEKHLMYVSFPKFQQSTSEQNMTFNNRFFKKIFFNYSRELYEYNSKEFDVVENVDIIKKAREEQKKQSHQDLMEDEQQRDIRKQFQLKFDPERYFESIKKMYKNKQQAEKNKNIFIFPISFKYLQQEFSNLFADKCGDALKYASYFVWFIIRDFLYDDIRKFNPNMILISYSGKVNIRDEHFIKMTQQLATISRRRMLFYPNFSTQLVEPAIFQSYEQYDNFVIPTSPINKSCTIDLMRKFSQFLKISSGTYNLELSRDRQTIIPRLKLAKLNSYIRGIMSALSHQEYEHLRNRISDLILRSETVIINKSVEDNVKQIKNTTPLYYQNLIKSIRELLSNDNAKCPSFMADLVDEIRSDIRSTSANNKETKENYLNDIQQKIQLELASEKYSQVAYVYFKTRNDKKQYDELKQYLKSENQSQQNYSINNRTSNNLGGLYALSLRNKENKQKIGISVTPRTEMVYKTDQKHRIRIGKKAANFMIMNNLENGNFVSYAGLVNLGGHIEENSRISTQRVQMFPITFSNMPNLQNRGDFIIRKGWNYSETSKYYILYWPQQFNILQAILREINDELYEPITLPEIYVCEIPETKEHRLIFNPANINQEEIIPRRFCSALQLFDQNKIFILGGFYDRQYNYLSLQRDITGLDLSHYNPQNHKCLVSCEKGTLFSLTKPRLDNEGKTKVNSYVRARRQYQFYDLEQLCELSEEEKQRQTQIRTYVMIGGLGQNFVRPFSLMSCNYYVINVHLPTMKISSIERKMVYENIITSNIKGFIKNNGYFSRMPLYQKNSLRPEEYIGTQEYIAHRSVYSIIRDNNKPDELRIKTKYFFALDIYNNFKKQYKAIASKIGEYFDIRTNDTSEFLLTHSPQGNHYLIIRKNKNEEETAQIFLQKMETKTTFQRVALTHGSIVSIDIKFKLIYAIVKHDLYTNGKFLLTQCEMPNEQSEVVLKVIQQLNFNLSQHYVFSPRPNEILLLHGLTFKGIGISDMVYRVAKRQNSKQDPLKMIVFPQAINPQVFKKCYTLMVKDQNRQSKALQVQSINILFPKEPKPSSYYLKKYRLKLSTQVSEFNWQQVSEYPLIFVDEQTRSQLHIVRIQEARQIQSPQAHSSNSYTSSSFNSPAVIAMSNRNHCGIIVKVVCHNKCSYIGMVSSSAQNVSIIPPYEQQIRKQKIQQIKLVNCDNKDAKKIWETCTTMTGHLKSLPVYEDMDVSIIKDPI